MHSLLTQLEREARSLGTTLVDRYPSVRTPTLRCWQAYRCAYARVVCFHDAVRHAHHTDLSPFQVVSVDPDSIEYLVERNGYPTQTYERATFPESKYKYAGTVRSGDWDYRDLRFEETDLYRAFEAHFDRGVPWRETAFYDHVVEYIENGVVMWGCTSETAFERRCERLDALYESIEENGYRSQTELAQSAAQGCFGDDPASVSSTVLDEVAVCIGRHGDLLFYDGRNRLAVAKLLGLDAIPVWFMVRHEQWQALRERVAADDAACRRLPAHLRDHPDLDVNGGAGSPPRRFVRRTGSPATDAANGRLGTFGDSGNRDSD